MQLHSVGTRLLDELESIADGPERAAAWLRLMDPLIDYMAKNHDLIRLHTRNRSAFEALSGSQSNQIENEQLEERLARILGSPAIPLRERVRMAGAVGIITEVFVESGGAFVDVPPHELAALVRDAIADLLPSEVTVDA